MHGEGGLAEFDAAIKSGVCDFLNELTAEAQEQMRTVYERVDAGDYAAVGELAMRIASASEQRPAEKQDPVRSERPKPPQTERPLDPVLLSPASVLRQEIYADQPVYRTMAEIVDRHVDRLSEEFPEPEPEALPAIVKSSPKSLRPSQAIKKEAEEAQSASEKVSRTLQTLPVAEVQTGEREVIQQVADASRHQIVQPAVRTETTQALPIPVVMTEISMTAIVAGVPPKPPAQHELKDSGAQLTVCAAPEETVMERPEPGGSLSDLQANFDPVTERQPAPDVTCEDFIAALQAIIELPAMPAPEQDEHPGLNADDGAPELPDGETIAAPPVIELLADRLAALEPEGQEQIAPLLEEITAVINNVEPAAGQEPAAEVLDAAETQLVELCITLFEALDIPYDESDVAQFVQAVLCAEFRPQPAAVQTEPDLEHIAMHEAKYTLRILAASLTHVENQLEGLIGAFVCARLPIREFAGV